MGWITEKNLSCSSCVQAASSVSENVDTRPCPALLMSMLAGPSSVSLACAKAATESASSTSQMRLNKRALG
ncbi:hypothetical protein D3C86_1881010 [compost metagenome]